jgi:hypothetical protein
MPEKANVLVAMEEFRKAKTDGYVTTAARSAGPFFGHALGVAPILHRNYWETGVIWGNGSEATYTNPTMVVTEVRGTKFAVHYGTEPSLPFHLSPAFAELSPSDPLYQPSNENSCTDEERASRIAKTAKSQFQVWSSSFRKRASEPTSRPCIRFVICNALSLCHALYEREWGNKTTSTYARQWSLSPMLLDGGDYPNKMGDGTSTGPTSFNVIDTSNLTDHVGLLNLLVSTVPCLRRHHSSTLVTESLLNKEPIAGQVETFSRLLRGDQTTMFLFFGVAPVSYLTGVSTQSTAMDSLRATLGISHPTKSQFQRRVEWKAPNLGEFSNRHLTLDAQVLAKFLFALYLDMFSIEGLGVFQDLDISKLSELAVIHYTRSSFADLILFLSSKINVDWPATIDLLLDHIITDNTLLVGTSNIQDL